MKQSIYSYPETKCFKDFAQLGIGNFPWVTIFKEDPATEDTFYETTAQTLLLFCKLYIPIQYRFEYLGYIMLEPEHSCLEMFAEAESLLPLVTQGKEFDVYVEDGQTMIRKINGLFTSVSSVKAVSTRAVLIVLVEWDPFWRFHHFERKKAK